MSIRVLGPVQVDGSSPLSPRDRVVLAALAVHCGEAVSAERLADALWGDELPASWPKVVQGCVVRLRRSLGKDVVKTVPGGYRLDLLDDEVDARVFERLVRRGRVLSSSGEPRRAAATFSDALSLWRGPALGELEHWSPGRSEAARLNELRQTVHEALVEVQLQAGDDAVPGAAALVTAEPLRERRWALLATALYRQDRQAEALGALRQARRTLLDELGIDPSGDLVALERAILNHDPELAPLAPGGVPNSDVCPYMGLVSYDRDNAEWFFGRAAEVARCLQALNRSPLLVVVGPSGCGKSSLIRAGVVPPLEREGQRVAMMAPGPDPPSALLSEISAPGQARVLVVDQLEELFSTAHQPAVVESFLDRLAGLAVSGWRVIVVVRADHLSDLAASLSFSRLAEQGMHLVTPMTRGEMTESIESPAAQAGLRLEPGLVELLLTEVEGEPGALPLLSHALAETWLRREADVLTVDGYRATGGIRSAVSRSAELLYESLDSNQRAAVRSILLRLVTPSPQGEPIAVRAPYAALAADGDRARVLDLLVRARLVTSDDQTVALAHEAVVRAWPRLQSWLDEDIAGQRSLRHLSLAADDWAATDRPDSELYRGARLEAVLDWRMRECPDLTDVESAFLEASAAHASRVNEARQQRAREQARSNRRLRVGLTGTAVGLVLALVAGSVAAHQTRVADSRAREAQIHRLVAESLALRGTQRDLAALLALQAYRLKPDAASKAALFGTFTAAPGFLGYQAVPLPLTSGHVLARGQALLASGTDGVIREIDLETGKVRRRFSAPSRQAASAVIALSADEGTVAELSWEGSEQGGARTTLSVFDVASGTLRGPGAMVPLDTRTVAVSPDGLRVAVSGEHDGRVTIYNTHARSGVGPAVEHQVSATGPGSYNGLRARAALTFTPDGLLIIGSETGAVLVVDPATGAVVRRLMGAGSLTSNKLAMISQDATTLLTTGTRGVALWDLRANHVLWSTPTREDQCAAAALATASGRVLCSGRPGAALSLDLETGRTTEPTLDLQSGTASAVVLTPDGRGVVVLADGQPVIARWTLDGTGPVTTLLRVHAIPGEYSPDGKLLLVRPRSASKSGPEIVDAGSGRVLTRLTGYESAFWAGSPTAVLAWTALDEGFRVEAQTNRPLGRFEGSFGSIPVPSDVANTGARMLAWNGGAEANAWRVWDTRTGGILATGGSTRWQGASLTADGRTLVSAGDGRLTTYDISSGDAVAVHEKVGLRNAKVSPAGVIAGSTNENTIVFLSPTTLRPIDQPIAGVGDVVQFSFSRDGQLLATHGSDGRVLLVDMREHVSLGDPLAIQALPDQNVALSPDGSRLALPDPLGILVWQLRPSAWMAAACGVVGRDLTSREWRTYLAGLGSYHASCS